MITLHCSARKSHTFQNLVLVKPHIRFLLPGRSFQFLYYFSFQSLVLALSEFANIMQRCSKPFGSEAIYEGPDELKHMVWKKISALGTRHSQLCHPLAVEDPMLATSLVPSLHGTSSEPTVFERVEVIFTLWFTMKNRCCNTVRPRK